MKRMIPPVFGQRFDDAERLKFCTVSVAGKKKKKQQLVIFFLTLDVFFARSFMPLSDPRALETS